MDIHDAVVLMKYLVAAKKRYSDAAIFTITEQSPFYVYGYFKSEFGRALHDAGGMEGAW